MDSLRVKNWRNNTKIRIVESMGGCCQICGYSHCLQSLVLHHIDPTQKEFSFGAIRANPKSWKIIVPELRKCILLCNNCHGEIHANMIMLPEKYASFNEEYFDYAIKTKNEKVDNCPICGQLKPKKQKTCSAVCAGKRKIRIDLSEKDLINLLKTKSVLQIAEELDCSDGAIYKKMKKYKIDSSRVSKKI